MAEQEAEIAKLRRHERTGRPLGSEKFLAHLESLAGRRLRPQKPEPKRREPER